MAGCRAVCGERVSEISAETGISREYIYQQKTKVTEYAQSLDSPEISDKDVPVLRLDKKTINRLILSLSLDCQSPNDGIVRFFETAVREVTVSAGYISAVISEASERAREFDDQIDLSAINQGANDEIFQCGVPVLTGIDPESTYTYLLEEAGDRTAETWELYLSDRKDHGLELTTSINDGGTGLRAGIPRVYPEVNLQADTFHVIYEVGREVSKIERKVYGLLKGEYALKENLDGKRPRKKNKEALETLQPKTAAAVYAYDLIFILYTWFRELLGFSGYSMGESTVLLEWIIAEMSQLANDYPGLLKEMHKVHKMLPSLLSFVKRLENEMAKKAKEKDLPVEAFYNMYRQLSYTADNPQSREIQLNTVYLLMERYTEAKDEFQKILNSTKKASSMVENLNGRIRGYMEVKRVIPAKFFVLLKVYFNTRRYRRSRVKDRIGKSPLELLTGRSHLEFLDALGY